MAHTILLEISCCGSNGLDQDLDPNCLIFDGIHERTFWKSWKKNRCLKNYPTSKDVVLSLFNYLAT